MQLFKRKKLDSRGFGHVELVVAVFVIVGVGLTGFFVNSHRPNQTHAAAPHWEYMGNSHGDAIWACRSSNNEYATFKQSWGGTSPPSIFWANDDENTPGGPDYWGRGAGWDVTTGYIVANSTTLAVSSGHSNYLRWSINGSLWTPWALEGQLAVC